MLGTVARGTRNDASTPNRCDQIVFADDAVAVLDEVDQQIKNLRLDRNDRPTCAQLPTFAIEREIFERKQHVVARNNLDEQLYRRFSSMRNQPYLRDKSIVSQGRTALCSALWKHAGVIGSLANQFEWDWPMGSFVRCHCGVQNLVFGKGAYETVSDQSVSLRGHASGTPALRKPS